MHRFYLSWLAGWAALLTLGCGGEEQPESPGKSAVETTPGKSRPKFMRQVEWDTGREQTRGSLRVRIEAVELGPVMTGNETDGFAPSEERFLVVRLKLSNVGGQTRLRYSGWSTPGAAIGGRVGRLLDDKDRRYAARTNFGQGRLVRGQVAKATDILAGRPLTDVLVFEALADDAEALRLELPADVVLEEGHLRFSIPAVAIQRK